MTATAATDHRRFFTFAEAPNLLRLESGATLGPVTIA